MITPVTSVAPTSMLTEAFFTVSLFMALTVRQQAVDTKNTLGRAKRKADGFTPMALGARLAAWTIFSTGCEPVCPPRH